MGSFWMAKSFRWGYEGKISYTIRHEALEIVYIQKPKQCRKKQPPWIFVTAHVVSFLIEFSKEYLQLTSISKVERAFHRPPITKH